MQSTRRFVYNLRRAGRFATFVSGSLCQNISAGSKGGPAGGAGLERGSVSPETSKRIPSSKGGVVKEEEEEEGSVRSPTKASTLIDQSILDLRM